jgi:DSF synthase
LASDIIIAEKCSLMGFPEAMFDLFPGMGALSLLSRRVGMRMGESMIRTGKIYSTPELFNAGLIDIVAEDGEGERAVSRWIEKNHRILHTVQAINKAKRLINQLTLAELYDIVEIWVDTALQLDNRSRRIMERLVRAQNTKVSVHHNDDVAQEIIVE